MQLFLVLWHCTIPTAIISLSGQQPTLWRWAGITLIKNLTVWEEVASAESHCCVSPVYFPKPLNVGASSALTLPFLLLHNIPAVWIVWGRTSYIRSSFCSCINYEMPMFVWSNSPKAVLFVVLIFLLILYWNPGWSTKKCQILCAPAFKSRIGSVISWFMMSSHNRVWLWLGLCIVRTEMHGNNIMCA